MTGSPREPHPARRCLVIALAAPLLTTLAFLSAPIASAASSSRQDVVWLHVEVKDEGGDHTKVKVNLPLSLIEVVVDSIDKREFMSRLEEKAPSLDIPRLWHEIRKAELGEFVTVESDKEHIKVWKDRDAFRISVKEEGETEPNMMVRIPLEIMDFVFDSKGKSFSFQELVESLRGHLPLTLVEGRHKDESVRIWLQEE
jgi:hypothetical protein